MPGGSKGQVRAWALAMDLVYGVIAGGVIGYLLDWWLGTAPWLTLSLSLVMLVGGMIRFIRAANRLNRGFGADARSGRFGTHETWDGDEDPADPEEGASSPERRG